MLDERLEGAPLLEAPVITVVSTVSPVESTPVPTVGNFIGGLRTAVFSRVPPSSASDAKVAAAWNEIERPADGTIQPAAARALLAVCAGAPPAEAEHRTVALMIVPRDDRGAALILALGLVAFALLVARRTVAEVDPDAAELRIVDRIGPVPVGNITVKLADVLDVVTATGVRGPLVGQRVELVLTDGSRLPLLPSYALLATRAHERTVLALKRALGLLTA